MEMAADLGHRSPVPGGPTPAWDMLGTGLGSSAGLTGRISLLPTTAIAGEDP